MSANTIIPCLWFDDEAEEAAARYTKLFSGGRIVAVSRYPESIDNPSNKPRGSVLTVEIELCGQRFTALNGGPLFEPNPSISFFVHVEHAAEVERIFAALADGGVVRMELGSYPWSERFGWVEDRFGVSWQVMVARPPPIVPCLMFSDAQAGRADEAMRFYTSRFDGGRIDSVERWAEGEGPVGTVKYGRFTLAGQPFVAMDSPVKHGFTFNEAVSLQVMCKGQGEVDRTWSALVDGGGQHGPCGWLKDPFGVSWQVAPDAIARWMASDDAAARDRAFAAMLTMTKLDVAKLEAAFAGP